MGKHAEKSLSWTIAVRLWLWTEVSSLLIRFAGRAEKKWRFALYEKTGFWSKTFDETISELEGK